MDVYDEIKVEISGPEIADMIAEKLELNQEVWVKHKQEAITGPDGKIMTWANLTYRKSKV